MSKYQFRESDLYLPGTDIPKNKLGIEDPGLLHEVEETLLQEAYQIFIAELESKVRFDEEYFKALHYRTFISLYEWAGEYRSVDISKGGSLFCLARNLPRPDRRMLGRMGRGEHQVIENLRADSARPARVLRIRMRRSPPSQPRARGRSRLLVNAQRREAIGLVR